jgi:hypothetical protein
VSLLVVSEAAGAVVFVGGPAAYLLAAVRSGARHERAVLKEHARAARAHFAAVEAAEDDPGFSPDAIEQTVAEVVALAEAQWRAGGSRVPDDRPDADLVRAWARSCQSWLGGGLEAVGKPSVDLVGVVNRDDEDEDRVVARVRVRIHCQDPRLGALGVRYVHLDERWTFGRSGSRWFLLSVNGDPLAGPVLAAPLIPTPASDTERLHQESLAELADAQKVGDDVALSDLVSAGEPPAFALLDLSVVDSRFLPALIAAELARILEAWEAAVSGSETPLEELTSVHARTALLRPCGGTRLIVRDVVLKSWGPTRLDLSRHPPAIEVTLDVEAVRYVVRDGGGSVVGNETDRRRMALVWTLELTASTRAPWRLATTNTPAEAIPGWP